jgi:predicted Zn-dependent protease
VYFHQGRLNEAEQQFRVASDLLPNEAMIQYHLGLVARKQGKTTDAVTALKRALLINSQFEEAAPAKKMLRELGG